MNCKETERDHCVIVKLRKTAHKGRKLDSKYVIFIQAHGDIFISFFYINNFSSIHSIVQSEYLFQSGIISLCS